MADLGSRHEFCYRLKFCHSEFLVSAARRIRGVARARSDLRAGPTPRARADRSHRQLGVDRHRRLALPHGDAAAKGDYAACRSTRRRAPIADKWDPAKDEADGNACKSYGAAAIMRVPGRLHISWQDDRR